MKARRDPLLLRGGRRSLPLAGRISGARIDGKDCTYTASLVFKDMIGQSGDGARFFAFFFFAYYISHHPRLETRYARNNTTLNGRKTPKRFDISPPITGGCSEGLGAL